MKSNKYIILFDANPLVNGNKSGIGYYTDGLIRALAKAYPDAQFIGHYFNFLGRKKNLKLPTGKNISYRESNILPGKILNICRKIGFQPPLELFFWKKGDAAIFTNFVHLPSILGTPVFTTVHDLCYEDVPEYVSKKNGEFLRKFVPKSVKAADRVITISKSTKNAIKSHYKISDEKIIITPIPPTENISVVPKKPDIDISKFILFVSTLEPRKNVIGLVKAYEKLSPSVRDNYQLVLAGGLGWYMDETMDYIQSLQKNGYKIKTLGYVSDAEKEWLYQNADLLVFPSFYEGFGMPILEAMAHNLPTLVSDIPVFKEVSGDASLYFDLNKPSDLSAKMLELLNSPDLQKELTAKGAFKIKTYSWSKVAKTIFEEIEKLS